MKVPLLLCVMLSAISASVQAQCTHEPVGKPLRFTPIIVQNAFLNGLRSIPDVVVNTGVSSESEDVVVYVFGMEIKDASGGNVMGDAWYYRVYRYWLSCAAGVSLEEDFDGGMAYDSPLKAEAGALDSVAEINVKTFEKLGQRREASHR